MTASKPPSNGRREDPQGTFLVECDGPQCRAMARLHVSRTSESGWHISTAFVDGRPVVSILCPKCRKRER